MMARVQWTAETEDGAHGDPWCPACRSSNRLPIIYGTAHPQRISALAVEGKVALSDDVPALIGGSAPHWHCSNCGAQWRGGMFVGGSGTDIASPVVISGIQSTAVGIRAERQFVLESVGLEAQLERQQVYHASGRSFDIFELRMADGSVRTMWFDISAFFGRRA